MILAAIDEHTLMCGQELASESVVFFQNLQALLRFKCCQPLKLFP